MLTTTYTHQVTQSFPIAMTHANLSKSLYDNINNVLHTDVSVVQRSFHVVHNALSVRLSRMQKKKTNNKKQKYRIKRCKFNFTIVIAADERFRSPPRDLSAFDSGPFGPRGTEMFYETNKYDPTVFERAYFFLFKPDPQHYGCILLYIGYRELLALIYNSRAIVIP